jgi:hypothetical protein
MAFLYADGELHSFYDDDVRTIDGYYRNIRLDRVVIFPKRREDYGIANILRGINACPMLLLFRLAHRPTSHTIQFRPIGVGVQRTYQEILALVHRKTEDYGIANILRGINA